MNSSTHPVEKEELMAYFDGELPVERGATVAAHIEQCGECRALAADWRLVSERLAAWQVEPSSHRLAERVSTAVQKNFVGRATRDGKSAMFAGLTFRRPVIPRWAWGVAGTFVFGLLIAAISIPNLLRSRIASNQATRPVYERVYEMKAEPRGVAGGGAALSEASSVPQQPAGPMIIRTASLTLVAKDFDQGRAAAEAAVRQHQGYSAQLAVSGQAGAGRTLTATFRVPADQLDAVLAELKELGRVEQESQGGEEVTEQYVDLGARLSNARHTEQRLIEVLRQHTGKVPDILAVEREIARVREQIERLEAQLKNLENRVRYASLQLRLSEEYKADLAVTAPSTGTRLRNAAVEGYRSVVESAVGLVLFLLSYGPVLLFWGLILYWPARFAWRRVRSR